MKKIDPDEIKRVLISYGIVPICFGLMIITACIGFKLTKLDYSTLNCHRVNEGGNCVLTQEKLINPSIQQIEMNDLLNAKIEKYPYDDGFKYYIILETTKEKINFSPVTSNDSDELYSIANEINSFIKNSNRLTLKVTEDHRNFTNIIAGGFTFIALLLILQTIGNKFPKI